MLDVLVVGAGPAGSIAALVLARAGARVLIVDRETFPRDKLCGDTLNPGLLALLASLGVNGGPIERAEEIHGMVLSGPRVAVTARYGPGIAGRTLRRRDLDLWLLERAIDAGARFESGLVAREPLLGSSKGRTVVRGAVLADRGLRSRVTRIPASMVIAADGARSTLGRILKLTRVPPAPRRWAFGTYVTGLTGLTNLGEMHVRPPAYLGIARLAGGVANVCVVTGPRPEGRGPLDVMRHVIDRDRDLSERFRAVSFLGAPHVLGPLAVDATAAGTTGLLLAGDAAGFIDPLTGDGLHLAVRGAVLAAEEALRTLETSDFEGAPRRLAETRRHLLGGKLRFNRLVRAATSSSLAVGMISCGAAIVPGLMSPMIRYAGDVGRAPARVA